MKEVCGTHHNEIEGLDELLDYVREKYDQGFWGEICVKFKNGVPYLIREMRQIKISSKGKHHSRL